jgi:hypothetical protein
MIWEYEAKQSESGIGGIECLIVLEDGSTEVLSNLGYHSPDGFQIGYGGSGPADLAYSIVMDYLLRSKKCSAQNVAGKAEFLHQQFKNDFIRVATQLLQVDSDDINEWLIKQEENHD